uniref:Uncharacterized protein n=1 Tax=viral metagenome TaxID=1070528 RepID=A0A6H1ZU98_9ZZZZ
MSEIEIWTAAYRVQGGRCFKCASPMLFVMSYKSAGSFRLVCKNCYKEPGMPPLVDEVRYMSNAWKEYDERLRRIQRNNKHGC